MNYPRIMDFFVVANNYRVYSWENHYGTTAIYRNISSPKESVEHLSTVHDKGKKNVAFYETIKNSVN